MLKACRIDFVALASRPGIHVELAAAWHEDDLTYQTLLNFRQLLCPFNHFLKCGVIGHQ
jgi:hypothetical protein